MQPSNPELRPDAASLPVLAKYGFIEITCTSSFRTWLFAPTFELVLFVPKILLQKNVDEGRFASDNVILLLPPAPS